MDFTAFNSLLLATAGVALCLALASKALQNRLIASEPLVALMVGLLIGPHLLGWVRIGDLTANTGAFLEQATRLTLSIAIMTATLRVGATWTRRNLRDLLLLLLVGLVGMWLLSWAMLWLTLGRSATDLLLLAAIVTPTDPVLAQSVVTAGTAERWVPSGIRNLISMESAANDGLSFLLVVGVVAFRTHDMGAFTAQVAWLALWEVGGAAILGCALGLGFGWLLNRAGENWTTDASAITVSVSLSFATLALAALLGMDGLFAIFAAGLSLSLMLGEKAAQRSEEFNHATARLFQLPVLLLVGVATPLDGWRELGLPLLAAVALILLFRRLPVLVALRPALKGVSSWPGALFVGWFGPIGLAAIFYATLVMQENHDDFFFVVASAVVAGSVLVHGVTDTIGSKMLGRACKTESEEL